jgi:hypothetical protein
MSAQRRLVKSRGSRSTECVPSFPRALESNANAAVTVCLQPLKGERRSRNVTARYSTAALKTLAVATVHRHSGVDVDAADFGERPYTGPLYEAEWTHELGGLAFRRRIEQLYVRSGRGAGRRGGAEKSAGWESVWRRRGAPPTWWLRSCDGREDSRRVSTPTWQRRTPGDESGGSQRRPWLPRRRLHAARSGV